MTQFEYLRPHSRSGLLRLSDAGKVANSLKQGSLAILPTETGYMLAALATSTAAIKRAFSVKERAASNVMHVACSSLDMARTVGILSERSIRLLSELTPGPVTVIVNKTPLLPDRLVTINGTVGIRIPDHPATLQIIGEVGAPVTATSLNSSGSEAVSIDEADLQLLNWPANEITYVLEDDKSIAYSMPSTLVRVSGEAIEILRAGPAAESEIHRVAG